MKNSELAVQIGCRAPLRALNHYIGARKRFAVLFINDRTGHLAGCS